MPPNWVAAQRWVTPGMGIGWEGTLNLLRHAGVLTGAPSPTRTVLLHTASRAFYVMATIDGLFEHSVDVGADVERGDWLAGSGRSTTLPGTASNFGSPPAERSLRGGRCPWSLAATMSATWASA